MNPADLIYCVLFMLLGSGIGLAIGYRIGERTGRDLQRVDDLQEMWRWMPERDFRGRFRKRSTT